MADIRNKKQEKEYHCPQVIAGPRQPNNGMAPVEIKSPETEKGKGHMAGPDVHGDSPFVSNPLHFQQEKDHHKRIGYIKPELSHPHEKHDKEMGHHPSAPGKVMAIKGLENIGKALDTPDVFRKGCKYILSLPHEGIYIIIPKERIIQ
jgi:hypothetical protein